MGTDVRAFRRVCYEAARGTGGSVVGFRIADEVTPNFHQGLIGYWNRTVAVIGHRDRGLLAVAEPRYSSCDTSPLIFVDIPDLMAVLKEQPGYRVLTVAELSAPFDAVRWPEIFQEDVRYWKPGTLGEALFNYWD